MAEGHSAALDTEEAVVVARSILAEVSRAVIGKQRPLELMLMALLADGHVLLEDYPGLAKTLMARCFAVVTGLEFARVQFTPDLMPLDVTGSPVLDPSTGRLEFRPGPIFCNLLLADEINRAPAKTQASLLEAMQERQVTVDGVTRPLAHPFLVVATQNPIEYEGTYPLPEAQLDRFIVRLDIGYPSEADEIEVLRARADRGKDEVDLTPVIDAATLRRMQRTVETVHVDPDVATYMVQLTAETRGREEVLVGASPRGSLALLKMSRSRAAVLGRDFVTPDDVKAVAVSCLAHRLILRPEYWVRDLTSESVIEDCLDAVPVPESAPTDA